MAFESSAGLPAVRIVGATDPIMVEPGAAFFRARRGERENPARSFTSRSRAGSALNARIVAAAGWIATARMTLAYLKPGAARHTRADAGV